MRLVLVGVALIAGVVTGAALTLVLQDGGASGAGMTAAEGTGASSPPTGATTTPAATAVTTTTAAADPPPSARMLLVWTPGALPAGFTADVAAIGGVEAVTTVRSDIAHLVASRDALGAAVDTVDDGYVIPLEVMSFDPATYGEFVPAGLRAMFESPPEGAAILGRTSAELRRIGPGGTLLFDDGTHLVVTAIVDDEVIGAAEAAVPMGTLQIDRERYLLVRYQGERADVEAAIRGTLPEGVSVRVRGPGETPVFRHGDAVLPQTAIKVRFGEFAYRPGDGQSFDIDPEWRRANIVGAEVPLLGSVVCHRSIVPLVIGAMQELIDRGLSHIVDRSTFRGCFNPRYIAGRRGISRHAWGVALDINWGANPTGLASAQDPRLVEAMDRWGFTSGHDWLIPDAGHFEWHHG